MTTRIAQLNAMKEKLGDVNEAEKKDLTQYMNSTEKKIYAKLKSFNPEAVTYGTQMGEHGDREYLLRVGVSDEATKSKLESAFADNKKLAGVRADKVEVWVRKH